MEKRNMLSRREALRIAGSIAMALPVMGLFGCAGTSRSGDADAPSAGTESSVADTAPSDQTASATSGSDGKALVAFLSRAGENYDVGTVEVGNTEVIAQMIAEKTGADLFKIETAEPYPAAYDEMLDIAKDEQSSNARPELAALPANLDEYGTIFLGYPIWWGDMPMALYSFLEQVDLSGKTIVPFNTHAGSGQASTVSTIERLARGATVRDGIAIAGTTAQNSRSEAARQIDAWLAR